MGTPTHSTTTELTKPSKPKNQWVPQHTPQLLNSQNHQNPKTSGYPNTLHKYKTHKTIKTQKPWVYTGTKSTKPSKPKTSGYPTHSTRKTHKTIKTQKPVGTPTHSNKYRTHKTIKIQNQCVSKQILIQAL